MSEKNEWKPIESAPKDELILVGPTKRMGICVAMNSSEHDGWVTETINEWHSMYTPTHWMPLPAAPGSTSSAPGDAQDERQDWMTCDSRRPWVTNSLKASAEKLRNKERRCRAAYTQDFYGVPARYVADVYAEAAAVFETKLSALAAQVPQQGEA